MTHHREYVAPPPATELGNYCDFVGYLGDPKPAFAAIATSAHSHPCCLARNPVPLLPRSTRCGKYARANRGTPVVSPEPEKPRKPFNVTLNELSSLHYNLESRAFYRHDNSESYWFSIARIAAGNGAAPVCNRSSPAKCYPSKRFPTS
jgi:hypothetical protein